MNFTNGEDRILFVKIGGSYLPIGCLTSNGFDESSEMMDTSTRDNKGWSTSMPLIQSYSIPFSGLQLNSTLVGGNFNVASYDKLKGLKRNRIRFEWKIQGTKYPVVDYGEGYISGLSEANDVGEFMGFSGTITGFGIPLTTSLGTVLLNNGDPNVVIATDATGLEVLRVSKF
jgi:hypothetical protein